MATTKTTKAKKVATPIDERETFVSLQKTFADSDISVEEKLGILYNLQQADNDIDRLVQLRGELPAEVEKLESEIAGFKAKVQRLQEAISLEKTIIEENKQQIVETDAEIEKYRSQLEGISNSREYDSINKEIENTGYLRQIAIKHIDEANGRIREHEASIEALQDRLSILDEDLKAKQQELEEIVTSTSDEEKALAERRESFASKLDERTISAYERIRASVHNHLAVVPVYHEDSCGGCFNTITPQRLVDIASGKKLVICEHCGRIIVNKD